jgi:alginate O-acetyltransferase complex protein AlgI
LVSCCLVRRYGVPRLSRVRTVLLIGGIALNLSLLGFFKYANFFASGLSRAPGIEFELAPVLLPIAISFFTFQQITFLVDSYKGRIARYDFLKYCLFVTFFPQLIAGPIVQHSEVVSQYESSRFGFLRSGNLAIGITIFAIGLFKKVAIADGIGEFADPVFDAAAAGQDPHLFAAWGAALSYTFQIYFDFSGYSDMAIGLGRMFGVRLPLNFYSPYKATSIIDFWRLWHITLSRFLRDYVYKPLGGNRKGNYRRYANLMVTMLLGGLWHGAGWTFVIWGGLHGLFLVVNHAWRAIAQELGLPAWTRHGASVHVSRLLTFLAVVVAFVFFRADSFNAAMTILTGMVSGPVVMHETHLAVLGPVGDALRNAGVRESTASAAYVGLVQAGALAILLWVVWYLPNTQQLMRKYRPALTAPPADTAATSGSRFRWRPTLPWVAVTAIVGVVATLSITKPDAFIYFQF